MVSRCGDNQKSGTALRYFQDPTRDDSSIGSANDYRSGMDVHHSSGVFNKAFYTLANRSGWNVRKAFDTYVKANQYYWPPSSTFQQGAQGILDAAASLKYNTGDVIAAFAAVDMTLVWSGDWQKESSGVHYLCPKGQILVAREHVGDENGNTRYNCITYEIDGKSVVTGKRTWSPTIKESAHGSDYTCRVDQVMVGRDHDGDENGPTHYLCETLKPDLSTDIGTQKWIGTRKESSSNFTCPGKRVMVGRKHNGDENGNTDYKCANLIKVAANIVHQGWSGWKKESLHDEDFTCPWGQILVGRQHKGDENGSTRYKCTTYKINGKSVVTGKRRWSHRIKESSHGGDYTCPVNQVMVGRDHDGDEHGPTYYLCQTLKAGFSTDIKAWQGAGKESSSSFTCSGKRVMVGRAHHGDEHGSSYYKCAEIIIK